MHMGLSSAMDRWDEWKLRFLVLCSLFIQFFLYFAETVRTWYALRHLRVIVWIAYIGGDALAIYALATLFNRQKQQMVDGGGNALEVIWAPVLLIQLGGQYISTYSLEDNELWKRHAITLVSQVTVALYVFCKWWSGEKRLLQAAILLFIVGIIKFSQKPWALWKAGFRTMASTNLSPRRDERSSSVWSAFCTYLLDDVREALEGNSKDDVSCSLEEYVKEARELVKGGPKAGDKAQQQAKLKKNRLLAIKYIYKMFLDLSSPYFVRLHYLRYVLEFDHDYGHKMLRQWIERQFLTMYTKKRWEFSRLGLCFVCLLPSLVLTSVVLFATSGKDGYNKSDITVTYILFSGTAVLESGRYWISLVCVCLFGCHSQTNRLDMVYSWQDMVSQHNIMLFCARKKQPSTVMKLAALSCLKDYINKHWNIWHEPAARQISALVRQRAEDGWKEYISDPATYRRFNNFRGEQTLRKHQQLEQLVRGFNLPYDEYVLVWHVATSLCFHHTNTSPYQGAISSSRCKSKIISNYMIYLLLIFPEMLVPGTRQDLFRHACREIEHIIEDEPSSSSLDERSISQQIIRAMEQGEDLTMRSDAPMISNAHKLAKALILALNDETERWDMIQGVWVEMLCYSASRCRGYDHAKSLAHGGEYLTNVWLLWSCMGMETLFDKMHMPDPPAEEQTAAASV